MIRNLLFILFIALSNYGFSQNLFLPINHESNYNYDKVITNSENSHSCIKPFIEREITEIINDTSFYSLKNKKRLNDNIISSKNQKIVVNPIITYIGDVNSTQKEYYSNIRYGADITSKLTKKIGLGLKFFNSHGSFPAGISNGIDSTHIIPHFGKYDKKSNNTYSYFTSIAYVSYSPSKYFNFQLGNDKNFLGDGYRSLQLSDNSNFTPSLKGTLKIWKVKYLVLYSLLKDVDSEVNFTDLNKKYNVIHYLSWNIGKRFNLNLFETVIWNNGDSQFSRGYDVNYLNPIIFYRPVEYSIGSPDNVIMGAGYKLRVFKQFNLYGQITLDEFKLAELKAKTGWWANKYAYQLGFKAFDLLNINGLYAQAEYNYARPFIYSHYSSLENFGNYNQPMAHPIGANFNEYIAILKYKKNRTTFNIKTVYAKYGTNKDTINVGQNIYLPNSINANIYGNYTLQGNLHSLVYTDINVNYLLNPKTSTYVQAGVKTRKMTSDTNLDNDLFFYFGIVTKLYNNETIYY